MVVNVFNQEYLPYLCAAAKASGKPGMSCDKAAVINISSDASSMVIMPSLPEPFPYSISKVHKKALLRQAGTCVLKLD